MTKFFAKLTLTLSFSTVLSLGAMQVFAGPETCQTYCDAVYAECQSQCSPLIGEGAACLRTCRMEWTTCSTGC